MLAAEGRQFGDPGRVIVETREGGPGLNTRIEPGLRNIHSTNDLHHGNLPCSYDRDPATVRSCVTTAKIPGLTHGCCRRGVGRHRRALWPVATGQSAQSLPSHILLDMQIQGVTVYR